MNSAIYRDSVVVAEGRREEALRRWRGELAAVPDPVRRVYARRMARTAAGAGSILVAAATVATAFHDKHGATAVLLLSLPLGLCAYLVGYVGGALCFRRALARASASTGDVWRDLDRFETGSPLAIAQQAADRLEKASVALPMIGISLCAPLLLHFLYYVWDSGGAADPDEFDEWVRISAIIVGHCHIVLGALCWRFASRVRGRATADLAWAPGRDGWSAWGITIASSVFPGIALLFIPVLLVAVTGLLFIPVMFRFMSLRISRERLTLVEPHDAFAYV